MPDPVFATRPAALHRNTDGWSYTCPAKPPTFVDELDTVPSNEQPFTSDREQILPAKPPACSAVLDTVPYVRSPSTRPPAMLPKNPAHDAVASTAKLLTAWLFP